ncbi:aspartate aminotransferase family protein [Ensifer sp. SSB1]|jgi:4-aminobutyrate--pyruvate transaminase|uniref:aspartate aminotransferase family protein n=1 Tax=Ensifer sp. SSB1 TaxID=2795385 RepID=UPI001A61B7F0|nr:aspartate aminotransferase family protein [Ensifer sp. SSB1]MBK5569867.1 aspartate aminotransferase family protein [Ensifer sp. SSB1]
MTAQPNSTEARNMVYHLHSYTNPRRLEREGPMVIERGEGIHVFDNSGKRYIEGMAGLWSVAVGFGEKRLVEAARKQLSQLPYYHTFSQKSHGPVADLAEKLVSLAPVPMSKVYFANSGSEANDTAIKLVWYRSNALGRPEKKKIISRIKGYHGVTALSASLTGLPNNHRSFDLPFPNILHTTCPHYRTGAEPGQDELAFSRCCAEELEAMILEEGPETIAAFIGEPVMGAGGVIVPPEGYWAAIQEVLDRHDILLIADEVICGFGRTGNMFGSQTYGLRPDIMTVSKQLSSSYQPISALMINERVFEPIACEADRIGVLGHGYTASGHPVAAAVSLENLAIIEERDLVGNVRRLAPHFLERLNALERHPLAVEARGVGLIGALELEAADGAPTGTMGARAAALLQKNGLISRNIGDAIAFCPPMIITRTEVNEMFDIVERSLKELAGS